MRTQGRAVVAIACGGLWALAGCNALLGLDARDGDGTDGSVPSSSEAGGEGGGGGGGGGGGEGGASDGGGTGSDGSSSIDSGKRDGSTADTGSSDTGTPDSGEDSGCSALGDVPDGAPRTFYGSCVVNASMCNAYGYTGDLGVTALSIQIQKTTCANLSGTWADAGCNLTGAVFGCEHESSGGYVCATLAISWFYPPRTVADEDAACPAGTGTVVLP